MNFKNFSRAQFSKLRNGINGVREFLYDTILYVAKISYQSDNWYGNCWGGPKLYTDTHTDTHKEAHFISLVFLRKCRNKTKKTLIEKGVTRCPDHLSRQFLTTASTFPCSSKNSSAGQSGFLRFSQEPPMN